MSWKDDITYRIVNMNITHDADGIHIRRADGKTMDDGYSRGVIVKLFAHLPEYTVKP